MLKLILIELYVVAFGALLFVLVRLIRARRKLVYVTPRENLSHENMPTVSVCIPARNETNSMSECLESVLSNDYPKLEIIVIDDNSSDNTSHIIRAFAHAGVRFISGDILPSGWIGKNYSLQQVADQANGSIIMFLDVDTRLKPESIRLAVEYMQSKKAEMLSIIPQRYDTSRPSAIFSTLRYFWEIVLSSRSFPGSSSAAWLVSRRLVSELGGFKKWKDEVQLESNVAAEAAKTDEYQIVVSTPTLGVNYEKKWSSQVETSRRLLLPQFGNSVLSVLLGASLITTFIVTQVMVVFSILENSWSVATILLSMSILAFISFAIYFSMTMRTRWLISALLSPYIVTQELFLLILSIIGYQRGSITWKGRKIERPKSKRALSV